VSTAELRNKKYFETELLLSQGLTFKACKIYIIAIFTHLFAKLHKYKNLRCSFKAAVDAAVKRKISGICSPPELSEKNLCECLQTKFTSPLDGIQ